MTIAVSPQLEARLRAQIASGRFPNEEAVLVKALDLLDETEHEQARKRQQILDHIDEGIAQLKAGQGIAYDSDSLRELFERLKERAHRAYDEEHGR